MVEFIGVERMRELVLRKGVHRFIGELSHEIERDYRRWSVFEKSPRHATHSKTGVIELMPTSDGEQYAFKYVNGHPKNSAHGLLTVMAFGVLADVQTGYPLMLSEMTLLTALRTAATSVMAAKLLARLGTRSMALIGNGSQSEFQAIGFYHLLGIRELRLFDVDKDATAKLCANLSALGLPDLRLIPCNSVKEACKGADIVTTVTADKRNAVIITPDMVEPGMHLNAVGGDCPGKTELHPDVLKSPNTQVFVEFEPQSRIEGEIQQLAADFKVTEIAEVFSYTKPGRTDDKLITVFDSVGFALEDFSALRYVHRLQQELTAGQATIELVPDLENPKDLFSLLVDKKERVARMTA